MISKTELKNKLMMKFCRYKINAYWASRLLKSKRLSKRLKYCNEPIANKIFMFLHITDSFVICFYYEADKKDQKQE